MISVVMSVCLAAQPTVCKDVSLQFAAEIENVTPFMCNRYAQPEMAKWIAEHPKWKLTRWKCISSEKKTLDI